MMLPRRSVRLRGEGRRDVARRRGADEAIANRFSIDVRGEKVRGRLIQRGAIGNADALTLGGPGRHLLRCERSGDVLERRNRAGARVRIASRVALEPRRRVIARPAVRPHRPWHYRNIDVVGVHAALEDYELHGSDSRWVVAQRIVTLLDEIVADTLTVHAEVEPEDRGADEFGGAIEVGRLKLDRHGRL